MEDTIPICKLGALKNFRIEFFAPADPDDVWEAHFRGNHNGTPHTGTYTSGSYEGLEDALRTLLRGIK